MKTASEIADEWHLDGSYGDPDLSPHDRAVKWLEAYAEQFKPKWISINDRLPEPGEMVLVTKIDNRPFTAFLVESPNEKPLFGYYFGGRFYESFLVTFWTESLPNPHL